MTDWPLESEARMYIALSLGVVGVAGSIAVASPVTFGFHRITTNGQNIGSQLSVDVDLNAGNPARALFVLRNTGPVASSITDVYFDDDASCVSPPLAINNGPGVRFSPGASPGNLPGGNAAGFSASFGLSADSDPPVQSNGVNPGESVGIVLVLDRPLADLLAAMTNGTVRVGIHVQGIALGPSDSYISGSPPVVPLPAAVTMGGAGMLGLVGINSLSRRRRN